MAHCGYWSSFVQIGSRGDSLSPRSACARVVAGIKSLELLSRFVGMGLRFISAGTDIGMMTEAATTRAQALRGLSESPREPICTNDDQ
ncbi:hypothetical protein A5701_09525 [Mycobacterium sp. E3305]|nr:hypothetical protein A5701_09525 [Mycobacterium sp. E3305]